MNQKRFAEILSEFGLNPEKAKRSMGDKRLTLLEKVIIECYLLHRDKKNAQVIETLSETSNDAPPFVMAHKNLLFGMAYCNLGVFSKAESYLKNAISYFSENGYSHFEFISKVNLYFVYLNSKQNSHIKSMMRVLQETAPDDQRSYVKVLMCEFFYHTHFENIEEAKAAIEKIQSLKKYFRESEYPPYLTIMFDFYVVQMDFKKADKILDEMKLYRKYNMKETFKYCRLLLDHYRDGKSIYFYEKRFENFPKTFHELKVIQHLEEMNVEEALKHWAYLKELYPEIYRDDFKFMGSKTIFFLCLEKNLQKINLAKSGNLTGPTYDENENHLEKLKRIFSTPHAPILQEDLYEIIWGNRANSKADLCRLSNNICRLRKKYGLDVKFKKGCYFLNAKERKKAS